MQIREFAERILFTTSLEEKLAAPDLRLLRDDQPGPAQTWTTPGRPAGLEISAKRTRKRLPHPDSLDDPEMRVRCLHTFANHELMALELMAWALLAYPDAPPTFRRGMLQILVDEQRHFQMYCDRIEALGFKFGDLPINDHFWRCAHELTTPLKFVSTINLTFEQANLDFAPEYQSHFTRVGDDASATLMAQIADDEVLHVGFGAAFLRAAAKDGRMTFDVWRENLTFHNTPERARGVNFNEELRRRAGLDEDFIRRMKEASRPG